MAQNTILAAGSTGATSTDVTVAAGATVVLGLFVASGDLPDWAHANVMVDTPGADLLVFKLTDSSPIQAFTGPAVYRVVRPSNGSAVNIGIFSQD